MSKVVTMHVFLRRGKNKVHRYDKYWENLPPYRVTKPTSQQNI